MRAILILLVLEGVAVRGPTGPSPTEPGPGAVPASPSSHVVLLAPSSASEASAFALAIEDHGASVGVEVTRAEPSQDSPLAQALRIDVRSDPSDEALGVFWLDIGSASILVYLYEPRGGGVYVRELGRGPEQSDAALVDSVGLIVASTAVALREGRDLAMRPLAPAEVAELGPDPAPPEPIPEAELVSGEHEPEPTISGRVRAQPRSVYGRVWAAYLGDGFNGAAPWQSGVRAGGGVGFSQRVRLDVGYGFLAPATVASAPRLRVARHEVGTDVVVGGAVSKRWSLAGAGSFAAEFNRWHRGDASGTRARFRLGPAFEIAVSLGVGLSAELGLGAMVALNRFDFVVCPAPDAACGEDAREVVASGWRVAPRARLGLSYRFGARSGPDRKKESPAR